MALNEGQKAAVEFLGGPLLVLAGPGTGKTQLLSSKVQFLLEKTDANPENILCLTFTDSGATNMRDRLYSMIGTDAGKVNIYTYHSFGAYILAEYKNYTTEYNRDLDSAIDTVTQYTIIKKIQDQLDPFDALRKSNIDDIISTISSAKSARLTGDDLLKIGKSNTSITKKLNPKLNDILQNMQKGMKAQEGIAKIYQPILELLQKFAEQNTLPKNVETEASFLAKELADIIKEVEESEKPSIQPLTKWKNRRFELDEDGNYRLKNVVSNLKLISLANILKKYETYLFDNGLFDFTDMIEQAITILKKDNGFKLSLQERYQYIMLDEFQDTNPAQAELIFLLSDYEQPQIMAVGDDDQAIYSFQGANASNLHNFKERYNAATITLIQNYRSKKGILDLSRNIREQITDSYSKRENIKKELIANKTGDADISRHEFIESSAEYSWIAEEIEKLINSGVKGSDIAIITPKHKYVTSLLPFLKKYHNIDISYEKRENLFEDERIHELLTISRFIYEISQGNNPSQMLFEILSFPFLQISPLSAITTINSNAKENNSIKILAKSEDKKIQETAEFFAELVGRAENTPLELFIDYLTGTTSLPSGYKSNFLNFYTNSDNNQSTDEKYDTFTLYDNLSVLREAIIKHSSENILRLPNLISFYDDYQNANEPLVSTSPYRDSTNAVQILTAHKSKGLEFEYVFLIATDDQAWGNAKGNNNMLVLPANLTYIRHTGVTEDERLRLFFVAITRAKAHLIMTSSILDYSGKTPKRLEYLAEYEDKDTIKSPKLPEKNQTVEKHYQNIPEDEDLSDLKTSWISHYQDIKGEIRPILLSRLENYRLTATDLTTFIDVSYGGPQVLYERRVLHAPIESYSESISFGNLIHATFEQVTNQNLSDEKALEFFREQLKTANIPQDDLEAFQEKGEKSLLASLKKFGTLLRDENACAEVNLGHEHIVLDDIPLTGKIDHINIDKENKTIEIYDFKTSGFNEKKWGSHPTLYKYMLQLGFYKLLLNLSPTYSKYKITKAHILFVVPDYVDGAVHDKEYEYNEADEAGLKALIKNVYTHIKTLDFLDDQKLFIPPDSTKGIKDIKDFVKLLLDIKE